MLQRTRLEDSCLLRSRIQLANNCIADIMGEELDGLPVLVEQYCTNTSDNITVLRLIASIWMNQGTEDDGLVILPSGRRFLCKVKAGLRSSLMALDVEEYAWLETADRQLFAIRPNRLPELNCKRPRDRNASCFHNRFDSKMV